MICIILNFRARTRARARFLSNLFHEIALPRDWTIVSDPILLIRDSLIRSLLMTFDHFVLQKFPLEIFSL